MNLFRSEDMLYVRLLMNDNVCYDTIRELGKLGKCHIVDLSARELAPSDRTLHYKKRVAQATFYEKKLINFKELFPQFNVKEPPIDTQPMDMRLGDVIDDVKNYIEPLENSLTKNILYKREQAALINDALERIFVLRVCSGTLTSAAASNKKHDSQVEYGSFNSRDQRDEESKSLLNDNNYSSSESEMTTPPLTQRKSHEVQKSSPIALTSLDFSDDEMMPQHHQHKRNFFTQTLHGVVVHDKAYMLERMVFRVTRGNAVLKFTDIPTPIIDPLTNEPLKKSVFTILFMGEGMRVRLRKIITFFGATEYPVPDSAKEGMRAQRDYEIKLDDYRKILARTNEEIHELLNGFAWDSATDSSPFINWYYALNKDKLISDTLKKCDTEGPRSQMLLLEAWVPACDLDELKLALHRAVRTTQLKQAALQILPQPSSPPTYFKTDKFTSSFQGIVDTYGVPRYKEANPGLFTIITFPFLFGIMYGDVGHGLFVTLFALYMLYNEAHILKLQRMKQLSEIPTMAFGGRYIILLMGLFALYAGFIYNDCVSIPMNLFGSRWEFDVDKLHPENGVPLSRDPYPFGIDPAWFHTQNELAFFNSFKMKLAVTLGVTQMLFGIILGLSNDLYFGDTVSVFTQFLPRIVFMLSTFGYMVFLIIYKFCVDWSLADSSPPNLVQTMISMFLAPGTVDREHRLYKGQANTQLFLLFLALISVPIMFLGQPLVARYQHRKLFGPGSTAYALVHKHDDDELKDDDDLEAAGVVSQPPSSRPPAAGQEDSGHGPDPKSPHYSFSDHCITQGIHSIEFILGSVSNTASYLRLWALSLAHAELSGVFWSKMIQEYGINTGNPMMIVIGFATWFGATFAVLLCMDTLECFLHALRLHWVEFQSKFFAADGYAFTPFSFDIEVDES